MGGFPPPAKTCEISLPSLIDILILADIMVCLIHALTVYYEQILPGTVVSSVSMVWIKNDELTIYCKGSSFGVTDIHIKAF